jgi:hypothetical protein
MSKPLFPLRPKKPMRTLDTEIARIATLRCAKGLPALSEKPRTLGAAQEMINELMKSPDTAKAVAGVLASGKLPLLEAISSQLNGEDSASARLAILNRAISQYGDAAASEKDFSKQTAIYRDRAKIQRRQARELLDAGKLNDAFRTPPEDLA